MSVFGRLLPTHIDKKISVGFVLALVLIATGFVLTLYSYNWYREDSKTIEDTHLLRNRLTNVLLRLREIETGVRGYVFSKDTLYLENYARNIQLVKQEISELQKVNHDELIAARIDSLETLAKIKMQIAQRQMAAVKNREEASVLPVYMRIDKLRMDDVSRVVNEMLEREQVLMPERRDVAKQSFQNTVILIFVVSFLTFVTMVVSFNLLDKELGRRQQVEDQLRAYEEELKENIRQLKASNEELERFAFVASHDLQEPLRKIQAFGDLLEQRYNSQFDASGLEFLRKITASAERMSKMIKDLLNFSRISIAQEEFRPINLAEVVNRIVDDQELRIKALGALVKVDPLPIIEAVPSQMDHLFSNLLSNALKFSAQDEKPLIRISAEAVDGADYPELIGGKTYYKITIEDNGIGFDEKYLDHIFKVFQRLHGKTSYEGTGIGLAICKKVVMYHKGHITAQSEPNQGATFVIILPEKQLNYEHDRAITNETHSYSVS
ncbi:hypothetical protein GCM10023189_26790 [Nibrella saemangeumensis]|uniref:histidine kinase n=1 Tax=Nibrella saemangeumensis TaxID=1084526 RepID=A0ABP8MVL9_9BACT